MESPTPASNPSTKRPVFCVFCGSAPGFSPAHIEAAESLARIMHAHSISLVYGGGTVGIMGALAKALVSISGPDSVHGIIPTALVEYEQKLNPNSQIDASIYGRTTVVKDMHTRKQMMAEEVINGGDGSGFIALSGGFGTLEELAEIITWNQLGIHGRGIVVYNVEEFWSGLIEWVSTAVAAGFIAPLNKGILKEAVSAEECVTLLRDYQNSEGRMKLQWDQK